MCTWGGLLIAAVVFLSVISISANEPVTYLVFPALIWAALRFGPPGATLSVTLAAGAAIAFTANELGPFFRQPIDDKALSTQLYIATAALTTLFVGALVSERQRSVTELAESKQRKASVPSRSTASHATSMTPCRRRSSRPCCTRERQSATSRRRGSTPEGRSPAP